MTANHKVMPYVVLTCAECLRVSSMNLMEEITGRSLKYRVASVTA
jgi:hypothetical protein